jgi:60 kDa SS-A/Ro ribonucleoprotein
MTTAVTKVQTMTGVHPGKTHEGGVSYAPTFREQLAEFFSLGLLNGTFYQNQTDVIRDAAALFQRALKEEPEFTTKCAIYGNNENSLKLVPTIWLVYLSTLDDKRLFRAAFPRIIQNVKMLHDFLEITRHGGIRKGLGQGVKKVVNQWLSSRLSEYQVSRYKGKLSDVVKVTRPKNDDETFQNFMKYVVNDELSFPRVVALKRVITLLKHPVVNDEVLSLIDANKLQLEELKHATSDLSGEDKKVLYSHLYKGLNFNALVLNLVALERVFATKTTVVLNSFGGKYFNQVKVIETVIPDELIQMVANRLDDVEAYRRSNMLPFALITAERMVVTPEWKSALGRLIKLSANELFVVDESIELMVNVDTSNSMNWTNMTESLTCMNLATLFGAMVKKSHVNSQVHAVATLMKEVKLTTQSDVFQMAREIEKTEVGAGTHFEQIMEHYNGEKFVLLFTDSEQADNLESKWLNATRPDGARLIVWQLANTGTHISNDPSVIYLTGYSDRMLGVVKAVIEGRSTQIEDIESIQL